jgi:hypothetical protein
MLRRHCGTAFAPRPRRSTSCSGMNLAVASESRIDRSNRRHGRSRLRRRGRSRLRRCRGVHWHLGRQFLGASLFELSFEMFVLSLESFVLPLKLRNFAEHGFQLCYCRPSRQGCRHSHPMRARHDGKPVPFPRWWLRASVGGLAEKASFSCRRL